MLENLFAQMTDPTASPDPTQPVFDPLAAPGVVSILLSEAASRRLRLEGDCFAIIARGSYPASPGRMVIHCQSIGPNISGDLCKILRGGFHAVPTKHKPLPPPTPPPDATEDTGRAAYRRGTCEPLVRDTEERRRSHELKDLQAIDDAADQWLAAHGVNTTVDRWTITTEAP
jgi:hypothetical protein